MEIIYYGHSAFGVNIQNKNLLFDPFISGNPAASSINVDKIPADYILLSHGHGDHLGDTVNIANRTGAKVLTNYEITTWLGEKGVSNTISTNYGGNIDLGFCKVKVVLATHSSTLPDGSPAGNPCGFVVESQEGSFYYSGDTSLHYDMKLIGKYHRLDFAILCIGDHFTMGVKDSIIASKFIKCDTVIGMHYDTMDVIKIDHGKSKKLYADKNKTLHLMEIGSSVIL